MEAEISDDKNIGPFLENQDYLEKITKLHGYIDERSSNTTLVRCRANLELGAACTTQVKKIVRESQSQEVLDVALTSISSLISILSSMSSSAKLNSSL